MAFSILQNYGTFTGDFSGAELDFTTNVAEVTIVTGIGAEKSADKEYWVNGELTYTVVVSNEIENDVFNGGTYVDVLDQRITLASSPDPVQIDGVPVAYHFINNILTVDYLPPINPGQSITITFRVVMV